MKNQMKKILLAVAMVVVVAAGLLVYGSGKTASKGTTSVGTAKGFGGDVTVTLTLADGKIIGCTAEGKDETEGVGSTAIDQLPGAIAESGSIAVDGVAGATVTSNAIKEAAAAALTAAGLNPDDYKTAVDNTAEPAEDSTVDADVVIVGAGGAGMTAAIDGTCDIGMASRELKDSELAELTPTQIAMDGIAVIVNQDNALDDITMDQIRQIYTGEVTDWADVQ